MIVHICNPSYSGDREWEDYMSRPAQAKSKQDPNSTNNPGVVAHSVTPAMREV
jgi:hypothetical protein